MKDKKIEKLINEEEKRQQKTINLIASENYVSAEVREALSSVLVNKYSEGYPGKRYYPGNFIYDEIERLAWERIKKLFNLNNDWHINVQPYSGSPANLAIYFSLLDLGEPVLGMRLDAGGHLTHGHRVNFSGRYYKSIQYGVELGTGLIDYVDMERLAASHQPKVIFSGATAYPREIDFERIGKIAASVGAYHVADISHIAGLVVAGLHQSPFEHADVVMTTTHKTLRGPRAAVIICRKELADRIDRSVFPGVQGGPHNNQIAAIAVMAEEDLKKQFIKYQTQVVKNAAVLAAELKQAGFKLVTDGTDNHLLLLSLQDLNLESAKESAGQVAERLLEEAGINANRNSIAGDPSPFKPTGIRLGTPAVTTRGMKEGEMKKIAQFIKLVLINKEKPNLIRKKAEALCRGFSLTEL